MVLCATSIDGYVVIFGTQTNTCLILQLTVNRCGLLESNRGHVNILINDWIVYEDRLLACARSGTWPRGGKVTSHRVLLFLEKSVVRTLGQ